MSGTTSGARRSAPLFWQHRGWRAYSLLPLAAVYGAVLWLRRFAYRLGLKQAIASPLPVVVVGNLSVGGTGKTPLCAELVRRFRQAGWKPAIVSRGYGGEHRLQPYLLKPEDSATKVGDEPLMLQRQTGVPVCVCADRAAAVAMVKACTKADIVFSDDGLQHLRMERRVDIVVIDGVRGLGNRWLLPAGPLREGSHRLPMADLLAVQMPYTGHGDDNDQVVGNARRQENSAATRSVRSADQDQASAPLHQSVTDVLGRMGRTGRALPSFCLHPGSVRHLRSGRTMSMAELPSRQVHAVAGIGNPARFFDSLTACGLSVHTHAKPDHHTISVEELSFSDSLPVLITAKDAVKLPPASTLPDNIFEVGTQIHLSDALESALTALERTLRAEGKACVFTDH